MLRPTVVENTVIVDKLHDAECHMYTQHKESLRLSLTSVEYYVHSTVKPFPRCTSILPLVIYETVTN